mmetsp:Transcript_1086/g.3376  ORF Transcript_1086/g.3376 Transcript_1086/m.3376 type:complete len:241 (+) Transcript_1086:97-819(+)
MAEAGAPSRGRAGRAVDAAASGEAGALPGPERGGGGGGNEHCVGRGAHLGGAGVVSRAAPRKEGDGRGGRHNRAGNAVADGPGARRGGRAGDHWDRQRRREHGEHLDHGCSCCGGVWRQSGPARQLVRLAEVPVDRRPQVSGNTPQPVSRGSRTLHRQGQHWVHVCCIAPPLDGQGAADSARAENPHRLQPDGPALEPRWDSPRAHRRLFSGRDGDHGFDAAAPRDATCTGSTHRRPGRA